jgi:HEAT repeat protein
MHVRTVAIAASLLAAGFLPGCVTEGEGMDSATEKQIAERIAAFARLQGQEYEENVSLLGGFLRDRAVPMLIEALEEDPSPRVRCGCAISLGIAQDGRAREPLLASAQGDPNPGVRYTSAYALCLYRDARGLPVLFETLRSEHQQVRWDGNERLKKLTNLDFGFDAAETPERREAAAARWEAWYRQVGPDGAAMRLVPPGGGK